MSTEPRKNSPRVFMATALFAAVAIGIFWIVQLEKRVLVLENYVQFHDPVSMHSGQLHIVSADRVSGDTNLDLRMSSGEKETRFMLRGQFKIPDNSRPIAAWVSEWTPRAEMLKFDQFDIVA